MLRACPELHHGVCHLLKHLRMPCCQVIVHVLPLQPLRAVLAQCQEVGICLDVGRQPEQAILNCPARLVESWELPSEKQDNGAGGEEKGEREVCCTRM